MFFKQKKAPVSEPIPMPVRDELEMDFPSADAEEPEESMEAPVQAPAEETRTDESLEEKKMYDSDLTTSISRETVLTGRIDTKANLEVFGIVNGPIDSTAVIKAYGTIKGDIQCETVVANGAKINGNIDCNTSAVMGQGTEVKGNINAGIITVSGEVDGNILARESLTITETAVVLGDIKTPLLEIGKGAVIKGNITMERPEPVIEQPEPEPAAEELPPAEEPVFAYETVASEEREDEEKEPAQTEL